MGTTMRRCLPLVALLLAAACGREGALVSTPTPLASEQPTETYAPQYTPTYSPGVTGSPSPAPTETPTATPVATVTVETPTPTPTEAASKPTVKFETLEGDDRVRAGDAGVHPDGSPDVVLKATLSGEVEELIVTQCTSEIDASADNQWDTITGNEAQPIGYGNQPSNATSVLGVIDASDDFVNRSDGSLPRLHLTHATTYELHFQNNGSVTAGRRLCLTVERPDGSVQVDSAFAS
jgi:hypothetical protein